MSKPQWKLPYIILAVASALLAAGCQSDRSDQSDQIDTVAARSRPVVNALDYETAKLRAARIQDVEYDLNIDVHNDPDAFNGTVEIRFDLSDASSDLTIDFAGGVINDVTVNGSPARFTYNDFFLTLPAETLAAGSNSVIAEFEHAYDEDGTGLHRFVDPVDGLTYLYSYLWPYYANRLFPSFDQPNLKANISLQVTAPDDWTVVSTGTATADSQGDGTVLWRFTTTPKMSTYVFSLHAGPYEVWDEQAGEMPIRLMARRSLAEFVAVAEWFDVTKKGLEYFGRYFEIPYPFEKYDQLIVPDFNIGAMENIAAVTFSERYVQREESDRSQREARASVILHEMAHMWFGNLVTHDWWNGLWLNESFATQMSAMAMLETTEFTDTWHGFFTNSKRIAYRRDSRVTTHPIEMPIGSTADFFTVFDAITYQKGSSVLKQLAHYVGEENYRRGVSAYLKEHSYSTTALEDFIGHQAKSAGIDLTEWSGGWLYKAGFNTLSVETDCTEDGLQWLIVNQTAPEEQPYLRRHKVDVALYDTDGNGTPGSARVFPVTVEGVNTAVEVLDEMPCPAIVNPNHDDWAYAKIALDERGIDFLVRHLGEIREPLTRSMFLAALYDRAMAGDMPLADYIDHAMMLAEVEDNIRIQQQITSSVVSIVGLMQRLRPDTDADLALYLPELEAASLRHISAAENIDLKREWFTAFLGIVSTDAGLQTVRELLDGTREISGVPISPDMRWYLLTILSVHDADDIDEMLAAESEMDDSDFGVKSLLTATAARPDKTAKQKFLSDLQGSETLTGLAKQRAVMAGLFPSNQTAIQLELLGQVLDTLPELSRTRDPYFLSSYTAALLSPMCLPESNARLQQALVDYADRLNSTSLRFLREALQADQECLALRSLQ